MQLLVSQVMTSAQVVQKGQSLRKTVLFRTLPTTDEHTPKYKTIIKKKNKNPQVEQC